MGIHKNAVLTPAGREILVRRVLDDGQTPMAVATAMGVCLSTVRKWVGRFKPEGVAGLQDRSSRPHRSPARTPAPPCRANSGSAPSTPDGRRDRRRRWPIQGHRLPHPRTSRHEPHPNRLARMGLRAAYENSAARADELPRWLHRYNWHRPHGSLGAKTPISRLGLASDNVLRLHS